jgi:hypothetical protein
MPTVRGPVDANCCEVLAAGTALLDVGTGLEDDEASTELLTGVVTGTVEVAGTVEEAGVVGGREDSDGDVDEQVAVGKKRPRWMSPA